MSTNSPKTMRGGEIFNVFDYLRFPLIIAVVFIHSHLSATFSGVTLPNEDSIFPFANITAYTISEIIARIAVPLFFFMSGYLFFRNFETWSWALYFSKLKKRVRSLLIPYILWNAVVILGFYIVQLYLPNLFTGNRLAIQDYTIKDFLEAFWLGADNLGHPINYPFWFIRNLMAIIILSPIIWGLVRYIKYYALIVLGLCFVFLQESWYCFDTSSSFFFTAGAFFAYYKLNIIQIFSKQKKFLLLAYIIFASVTLLLMNNPIGFHHSCPGKIRTGYYKV